MILYFSPTGNSAHVARHIAAATQLPLKDLTEKLRAGDHSPLNSAGPWVVVAPTYAWQLPRLVRDWLLATPLTGSRDIYFVLTCGSGIGAAGMHLEALTTQLGMQYKGCAAVVMPENYIALFSAPAPAEAKAIIEKAQPTIQAIGQAIAAGEPLHNKTGALGKLLSGPINNGFYQHYISAKAFFTTDACTTCGLCAQICPTGSIRLSTGKPVWGNKCTHCMACITRCPARAIEYGKMTKTKYRYRCPVE